MIRKKKIVNNEYQGQIDTLAETLRTMKPGTYEVYICDHKPNRTLNQNSYYWGVVIKTLSDFFGYEKQEMHRALCLEFLKEHISKLDGEIVEVPGSTKNLNTGEMTEYIDKVKRWAQDEFDIYIPEANDMSNDMTISYLHEQV